MIGDVRLALAASPREWALRLHRHVTDHGGARVRVTVLQPADALEEDYDVFVADDTTSFLTQRLVEQLHRLGRLVLGVYDPADPRAKGELVELGVDDLIARDAAPDAFLACLRQLAAQRPALPAVPQPLAPDRPRGTITAVGACAGGSGATEVALALAAAASRRPERVVLVDGDEVAPALAQRLAQPLYPNLRAAVDAVQHGRGKLGRALLAVPDRRFLLLAGLGSGDDWHAVRPVEVVDVVLQLAAGCHQVILNVGPRVEDVPTASGAARYGQTRALLGCADAVVAVAAPTPVGVARLLAWFAHVRGLTAAPVHVVFNLAPSARFRCEELAQEVQRGTDPASVSFLPPDRRVASAAWAGALVGSGPFTRRVDQLARRAVPVFGASPPRPLRPARVLATEALA